jgi:hypothetical protein
MVINTSIIYESLVTLVLLLVVLASARGSFGAVCLPPGNWGFSRESYNCTQTYVRIWYV